MIREVNLLAHLPEFMQEYREMQQIMAAETPKVQKLEDISEEIKNNQFICSADEKGIKRFEDMLGIRFLDDAGLADRRLRVLSVWNNSLPYTYWALHQKLEVLCGSSGYTLSISLDNYLVKVRVELKSKRNYASVVQMLTEVIPANMIIDVSLLYNQHKTLAVFTHRHLAKYTHKQIRNEVLSNGS